MTSLIIEFEEFSPVLHGVPVGLFDGRFEFDAETQQIEWIEIDGWPDDRTQRQRPTLHTTVDVEGARQFPVLHWLRTELERQFEAEISERSAAILDDGADPHADHRLTAADLGVGRYR